MNVGCQIEESIRTLGCLVRGCKVEDVTRSQPEVGKVHHIAPFPNQFSPRIVLDGYVTASRY